jgi:hypothetical protein
MAIEESSVSWQHPKLQNSGLHGEVLKLQSSIRKKNWPSSFYIQGVVKLCCSEQNKFFSKPGR